MFIALLYPLMSLVLQWIGTREEVVVGNVMIFRSIESDLDHFFIIFLLLLIVFLYFFRFKNNNKGWYFFIDFFVVIGLVGIIIFGISTSWADSILMLIIGLSFLLLMIFLVSLRFNNIKMWLLFSIIFAFVSIVGLIVFFGDIAVLVLALLVFVAVIVIFGVNAISGVFITSLAFGVVFFTVLNAAEPGTLGSMTAGISAVIVFNTFMAAMVAAFNKENKPVFLENNSPLRMLVNIFLINLPLIYILLKHSNIKEGIGQSLIIFLLILPLVNALFDYLSIGLTRYLLAGSLHSNAPMFWGVIDGIGAVVLFLVLKLSLVSLLMVLKDANSEPLLWLLGENGLFSQIRANPSEYVWLYFTLFSTLIPTLVHLNLACLSLIATTVKPLPALFNWIADALLHPNDG